MDGSYASKSELSKFWNQPTSSMILAVIFELNELLLNRCLNIGQFHASFGYSLDRG
jgi:hypothetical protein